MTETGHFNGLDWQHALAIIQGSDDAIISKTIDGTITSWNPGAERLFGYTAAEAIGRPMLMLFPDNRVPEEAQLLARIKAGERLTNFETVRRCKDGRFIHVSVTLSPILDAGGHVVGASKIARDITEHKRAEWLEVEKQRAERAAEARAAFLANMSHELRTPMNVILGHTQLLLASPLLPSQHPQLLAVHQSAETMLRLVNDLLDIAQLDKGVVSLEPTVFDLRQLLTEVATAHQALATAKGLSFTVALGDWPTPHVQADALRLRQIVTNLVSNAVKFTHHGGVALRFELRGGQLHGQITDTGVGMAAADVARVFEPFAQADESNTRPFGGAGLGAAIAQQLVRLMGGTLRVQSQVGQGTTVDIELPLPTGAPALHDPTAPVAAVRPLRALLVDDLPLNLKLLTTIMEKQGHHVTAVDSGEAALAAMAQGGFDVVLMDVQMPGMTGLEATQKIRQLEAQAQRRPTPVIAVTASVLMSDREAAAQAGMDGFVGKPIKVSVLNAEMARVVDTTRSG
jgi:PAS domain S-box-containing protein